MNPLSTEERRALGLLLALLLIAASARWLERPKSILGDIPDVDIAALEDASREAKDGRSTGKSSTSKGTTSAPREAAARTPLAPRSASTATRRAADGSSVSAELSGVRIDVNRASADELMRLPGVGPALAARIIAAREQTPFRVLEDLRRVQGIGPALLQRFADHVTLPRGGTAGTAPTERASSRQPTSPARQKVSPTTPLDINRASATELEALPGIGPTLAKRLIARRDSLGRFRTWDDVDGVTGVGPALLQRMRAAAVLR